MIKVLFSLSDPAVPERGWTYPARMGLTGSSRIPAHPSAMPSTSWVPGMVLGS